MYAYLSIVTVFLLTCLLSFVWTRLAKRLRITGVDVHKPSRPEVPELGGVVVLPAMAAGLLVLYLVDSRYFYDFGFVVLVSAVAWVLGLVDDVYELSAMPKFVLSIVIGLPIFIFVNPVTHPLLVPFMKPVRIPLVYPFLALALIAGTANSFNSYDVVNGSTTFAALVIGGAMAAVLFFKGELGLATVTGMVAAASLGLFVFNAYPARLFIGDTGSFSLGAAVAAAAIASYNEAFLFVALLPMIVNAAAKFMSAGRIYEHHKQGAKLTYVTKDGLIASYEGNGGISLVRLLVVDRPRSEKQVFLGMALMVVISTALALVLMPFVGVPLRW